MEPWYAQTSVRWSRDRQSGKHRKAPLTEEEQTLESVRQAEAEASTGTTARSSHVKNSLAFPVSDQAREALRELARGTDNLVQLVRFLSRAPQ